MAKHLKGQMDLIDRLAAVQQEEIQRLTAIVQGRILPAANSEEIELLESLIGDLQATLRRARTVIEAFCLASDWLQNEGDAEAVHEQARLARNPSGVLAEIASVSEDAEDVRNQIADIVAIKEDAED